MSTVIELSVSGPRDRTPRRIRATTPVLVGRDPACAVLLTGWRIARQHMRIELLEQGTLVVTDLGSLGGTWTQAGRIKGSRPLGLDESIFVAGYVLTPLQSLDDRDRELCSSFSATAPSCEKNESTERGGPANVMPGAVGTASPSQATFLSPAAADDAEISIDSRVHKQPRTYQPFLVVRKTLRSRLLASIDLRRQDITGLSAAELRTELGTLLSALMDDLDEPLTASARQWLARSVLDETVGLGLLEPLIADQDVTEIMVNGAADVFIERYGVIERVDTSFSSDQALRAVIERMVAPMGRRIDESSPMVDARLADGSRVNAVLPPLALQGPVVTIRKFSQRILEGADLLRLASLSPAMLAFLRLCIQARCNIAISGGTGSGKTTLLNVLAGMIPQRERVITIEDAAELRLPHNNLVSLEARQSNGEGRGGITIRELVRNALRMRPDRLVVGECRGGETLDMLQAMNTGHDGSMTTLHANSARDVSSRLETMALMAGIDIPVAAIREQIASAIDIVVHQARQANGTRRIVEISEVTGIESGRLQMQCIFRFQAQPSITARPVNTAADELPSEIWPGRFIATGVVPQFIESVAAAGHVIDWSWFQNESGDRP